MRDWLQHGRAEGRPMAIDGLLHRAVPYLLAALITGLAAVARAVLQPVLGDHYPLGTFYAAVAVIGWFWGVRPAVFAAILGYWVGDYVFLRAQPYESSLPMLELAVYAAICGAVIALVYGVYERQRRLDQALLAHASARKGQKQAAAELELSETRYRSLGEAFDFGMWSADTEGRLTFVSPRFLEFVGVPLEQADEHWWSAIQAQPHEINEAKIRWENCKVSGEPWNWEYPVCSRDGLMRRIWTMGIPLRGPDGTVRSWAGLNLDVTERYNAARARDQARQRLEVVTNTMSVGVAQCNRDLEYTWMNPAYARGIGVDPEQIEQTVGRRIEDVLGGEGFERFRAYFLRAIGGETVDYEGEIGTGVEPSRWIHASFIPIWNGAPLPNGWVVVVSDLTQWRALEEQLRDANRRKDEFLATLAHELRNPLAPIRYATQLMKPGSPLEVAADARRIIDRQLAHMTQLLDDLLDVSRITRGVLQIRRERLDIRSAVRHAVDAARALAESAEQTLRVELPDSPLLVEGDETRLIQVVGNLINNAIKFTDAGGTIVISAEVDESTIVTRVRDSGRGIADELLPRVFDKFVQGEPNAPGQSGLGIGLALAKQMIDLHGGRIEAHSDGPHRGSEFRFMLPQVDELPVMKNSPAAGTKLAVLGADRIRILVVDDNVDAANTLSELLKLAGYQTRVAYDGRTAIEMAELFEPAVAILDIGLPHLSGHEVAAHLRSLPWGRKARLIALTGWGQEDDKRRTLKSGFNDHLTKPVDPELLLQRIIQLTRGTAQIND
jgi:PAS domain S-box-containing protein